MSCSAIQLDCGVCIVRPWRDDDLGSLVRYADNPNVAMNLRDHFPNPYTVADGRIWLEHATAEGATHWAIEVDNHAIGGIGLMPQDDPDSGTAEIGYWLGEPFWGRGIATAAVRTLSHHALTELNYQRLFAVVDATNVASRRVLEKAGYQLEGIARQAAYKNGQPIDQALYAATDEDAA